MVVHHKTHRMGWRQKRHVYLVDTGHAIEIPQVEASDLFEDRLLDPPYPNTRFFEVEIDESGSNGTRTGIFKAIVPVTVHRKPDWHFLRFRIRRGGWHVTERFQKRTAHGEVQWIYADDFNLLFISSGGRYDAATLMDLINGKLDAIVHSIRSGERIPSEFENKLSCKAALGEMFAEGVDKAFSNTVLYNEHAKNFPSEMVLGDGQPSGAAICARPDKAVMPARQAAGVHVDISEIEDLRDLSWLND